MLTKGEVYFGIIGQGLSGKTTLAKKLAAGFRSVGVGVLALTLPGDEWAEASWQTSDPDRFAAMFERATGCACFVEFSDASVGKFAKPFEAMFTRGRHRGHRVFAIAQRHTQVSPTIRDQWHAFWLFSCGRKTAQTLAEEFADDDILETCAYPPHQYLFKRRCRPVLRSPAPAALVHGHALPPPERAGIAHGDNRQRPPANAPRVGPLLSPALRR